jgi:hypothetical protein
LSAALTMLIWTMTCLRCVIFTGEFAAPAHGVEFFLRRTPVRQLRCQQVGGRDRVLHREIDANAVLPGWIDTDLTRRARKEIDGLHDRVLARTPAARWGAIDDFAGIAVFLARPRPTSSPGQRFPSMAGICLWDRCSLVRLRLTLRANALLPDEGL